MSSLLQEIEAQINGAKASVTRQNIGQIREISDGVCKIEGLSDCMANEMLDFGGGIISLRSVAVMRAISSLAFRSPGTIAASPDAAGRNASSRTSSRKSAFRAFASGPWHAKQFSDRMGRISRLKLTSSACTIAREASNTNTDNKTQRLLVPKCINRLFITDLCNVVVQTILSNQKL